MGLFQTQRPCAGLEEARYLCAGVDGGANAKAALAVEKHAVEQVTFASAVHACNRHDTDGALDAAEELLSLCVGHELCAGEERSVLFDSGSKITRGIASSGDCILLLSFLKIF